MSQHVEHAHTEEDIQQLVSEPHTWDSIPEERRTKDFLLDVVRINPYILKCIPRSDLTRSMEIARLVVTKSGIGTEFAFYINAAVFRERETMLQAVSLNYKWLWFTQNTFPYDREFILLALQNNGRAYELINNTDTENKNNLCFIRQALRATNGNCYNSIPRDILFTPEFILTLALVHNTKMSELFETTERCEPYREIEIGPQLSKLMTCESACKFQRDLLYARCRPDMYDALQRRPLPLHPLFQEMLNVKENTQTRQYLHRMLELDIPIKEGYQEAVRRFQNSPDLFLMDLSGEQFQIYNWTSSNDLQQTAREQNPHLGPFEISLNGEPYCGDTWMEFRNRVIYGEEVDFDQWMLVYSDL